MINKFLYKLFCIVSLVSVAPDFAAFKVGKVSLKARVLALKQDISDTDPVYKVLTTVEHELDVAELLDDKINNVLADAQAHYHLSEQPNDRIIASHPILKTFTDASAAYYKVVSLMEEHLKNCITVDAMTTQQKLMQIILCSAQIIASNRKEMTLCLIDAIAREPGSVVAHTGEELMGMVVSEPECEPAPL